MLSKGEQPDKIRIDVVVEGSGTVWIRDVEIRKQPLPMQGKK